MAKKKTNVAEEAEQIKAEIEKLKEETKKFDKKSNTKKSRSKKTKTKAASSVTSTEKVAKSKKATTKKSKKKPTKSESKKESEPSKETEKTTKKSKKKATTKKSEKKIEEESGSDRTLEEELEEQLSDEEIESFQIEKVDMDKLTNKVCDILAERESEGMFQSELWKKLKLTSRDGSRLALKLERMGIITREKVLEKGRWTYKLILKKTPISTQSIENAPCLICPVEQKCTLEGEVSPLTCQWIDEWVLAELKKPKKKSR